MAHWDGSKIIYFKDHPYSGYPGWIEKDCGCCNGIKWGGDTPEECDNCGGGGFIAYHIKSKRYALYPGGPFRGRNPLTTNTGE